MCLCVWVCWCACVYGCAAVALPLGTVGDSDCISIPRWRTLDSAWERPRCLITAMIFRPGGDWSWLNDSVEPVTRATIVPLRPTWIFKRIDYDTTLEQGVHLRSTWDVFHSHSSLQVARPLHKLCLRFRLNEFPCRVPQPNAAGPAFTVTGEESLIKRRYQPIWVELR